MLDRAGYSAWRHTLARHSRRINEGRVDAVDDPDALFADTPDNADGAQQTRCVVDQEQEGRDRSDPQAPGDADSWVGDRCIEPGAGADGEHHGKGEQADGAADD